MPSRRGAAASHRRAAHLAALIIDGAGRYTRIMRQGEISIGGVRLETAWWDAASAGPATLVLLHEGLGCVALWRDFPARLAKATGCGVFACSRSGYGGSDPAALPRPMDYMQREAGEVLPAVLDTAGIGACVLVGHSDGASIAAIHASVARDPRRRALVLIAPHYFVEDIALRSIAAAREAFERGDLRTRLARYHRDVDNAFYGWNDAWLDPRFRTAFDIRPMLPGATVPVLQIQGADDPYGTPAQPAAGARGMSGPVGTLLLPGVRHAPHLEAPQESMREIAGFVEQVLAL